MSIVQLKNLLGYLNGLSLSMQNRKWLAEHLLNPSPADYYESETFYHDVDAAEAEIAAGKGTVVEDLDSLFA